MVPKGSKMHIAYPFRSLVLVVWVKIAPAMLNNREHSKGYQMVPLSSRSAKWFGRDGASKEWAFVIYIYSRCKRGQKLQTEK